MPGLGVSGLAARHFPQCTVSAGYRERPMETYLVGGAVRDRLLGEPESDRDYVLVGMTGTDAEALERQGYRKVGRDFPIWISPGGEEYAPARASHRQTWTPETTLEEDLARRDLTINAMAVAANGNLVDPFGGQEDLKHHRLRHVSDAGFREDPLRVLRLARFASRFPSFHIARSTLAVARSVVSGGGLSRVAPERIWTETLRALMEKRPRRYFQVLRQTGALAATFPELAALEGVPQPPLHHPEGDVWTHTLLVLDQASRMHLPLESRLAALFHDIGKGATPKDLWPAHVGHEKAALPLLEKIAARYPVSRSHLRIMRRMAQYHTSIHQILQFRHPGKIVLLLQALDALRTVETLDALLLACMADARGRTGHEDDPYPQAIHLRKAQRAILQAKNTPEWKQLTTSPPPGAGMASAIFALRTESCRKWLQEQPAQPKFTSTVRLG